VTSFGINFAEMRIGAINPKGSCNVGGFPVSKKSKML